jgi:hypothetical protein
MAGGFANYYYTYTAWDVIRPLDTPPGYKYFEHLKHFFAGFNFWKMKPLDNVANEGYCLGEPGREYVIFLNSAKPFLLNIDGPAADLTAEWFQPFTATGQKAGRVGTGQHEMSPPAALGVGPVVLHLIRK